MGATIKLVLLLVSLDLASMQSLNFISTGYSSEMDTFTLDAASGSVTRSNAQSADENMTWLIFDEENGNLYATNEATGYGINQDSGLIARWILDVDGITFVKQETVLSMGADPTHLNFDKAKGILYVANYNGGNFAAYKINPDGSFGALLFTDSYGAGSGVNPGRQNESHAHAVYTFNEFVYVMDLGSDKIWHYRVQNDIFTPATPSFTSSGSGAGPRHAAIDPTTLNFFALNELVPIIDSYKIDAQTGQLTLRGSLIYDFGTAIGGEEQKGGEIALHPFLPILYITHRGNGAVLVFEITDVVDGTLNQIQALPVNGTTPRHFAISDDGKFLVVANRFENKVQTFKIQAPAGTLTFADEAEAELQASFIAFK